MSAHRLNHQMVEHAHNRSFYERHAYIGTDPALNALNRRQQRRAMTRRLRAVVARYDLRRFAR